jgi:hypothetical protein
VRRGFTTEDTESTEKSGKENLREKINAEVGVETRRERRGLGKTCWLRSFVALDALLRMTAVFFDWGVSPRRAQRRRIGRGVTEEHGIRVIG